jgi:hypothetical protein
LGLSAIDQSNLVRRDPAANAPLPRNPNFTVIYGCDADKVTSCVRS